MKCQKCSEDIWPACLCSAMGVSVLDNRNKPGRPLVKPEEKKRNFTTKLSPEWFMFLNQMKEQGHSKAWCIEQGLKLLKARFAG